MNIDEINKLGRDLEIYSLVDYIGKGFPIILPRGYAIIKVMRDYLEKIEDDKGYMIVQTPEVSLSEIYKIENRYDDVKEKLFIIEDMDNPLVLKPYSKGFYCSIFKANQHSYRELPIKFAETSIVFNNEQDIKGITKTRQRTVEDLCSFTDYENLENNIKEFLNIELDIINKLGLDVKFKIYNWDTNKKEEYIGTINEWDTVVNCFKEAMDDLEIKYSIVSKAKMYGPSIVTEFNDIKFQSIQVDFEISHRFDLKYRTMDNTEEFPICINCSPVGNYEKLIRILIEKYCGDFPFWITPEQIKIICKEDEYEDFAEKVKTKLLSHSVRTSIDKSNLSFSDKVDRAKELKIPYIITIDNNDYNNKTIEIDNKKYKVEKFIEEVLSCKTKF